MKVGRPSKYNSDRCQEIKAFLSEGASITAYAAHIGVSRETIYSWGTKHSEFSKALNEARTASEAWWEKQAMKGLWDKSFNSTVWIFTMKARFGWNETNNQQTSQDEGLIFIDENDPEGSILEFKNSFL